MAALGRRVVVLSCEYKTAGGGHLTGAVGWSPSTVLSFGGALAERKRRPRAAILRFFHVGGDLAVGFGGAEAGEAGGGDLRFQQRQLLQLRQTRQVLQPRVRQRRTDLVWKVIECFEHLDLRNRSHMLVGEREVRPGKRRETREIRESTDGAESSADIRDVASVGLGTSLELAIREISPER